MQSPAGRFFFTKLDEMERIHQISGAIRHTHRSRSVWKSRITFGCGSQSSMGQVHLVLVEVEVWTL